MQNYTIYKTLFVSRPETENHIAYCYFTHKMCPIDSCPDEIKKNKKLVKVWNEIQSKLKILRQNGISEGTVKLLFDTRECKISRMHIDANYRIFLSDCDETEVIMTPLVKAVYFLFLNHPEGIVLKKICNHYDELLAIYSKISNRSDVSSIQRSIRNLCNPVDNSINEKCAVIRRTFYQKFDGIYAEQYVVSGERGAPKRILLDRSMILWDKKID